MNGALNFIHLLRSQIITLVRIILPSLQQYFWEKTWWDNERQPEKETTYRVCTKFIEDIAMQLHNSENTSVKNLV